MTQPTAPAAPVKRTSTVRTFAEGLGLDVGLAVVLAIGPTLAGADFAWTRAYWLSVGLLAGKTAIQTAVAYVAARKAVPKA